MSVAAAFRDWLRAQGYAASAGGPAQQDGLEIVAHDITSTGDTSDAVVLHRAQVQFDVWGGGYGDAAVLAEWLRRRLAGLRGDTPLTSSVTVLGDAAVTGPGFLPDPEADRPRFVLTAAVTVRRN